LKILLQDEDVDAVMVILPPPPMFKAEEVAEKLNEVIGKFPKSLWWLLVGFDVGGKSC
jgi:acyl-CoA synthetase (NDP forming)